MSDQQEVLPPGYTDYDPGNGPRHARARRRRGSSRLGRHPILVALAIFVVVILIVLGIGYFWADGQINPGGHRGPNVAVSIPAGSSKEKIGEILAKAGVIHGASLFALYVNFKDEGPLLPGSYSLPKNSTYEMAIAALEKGPTLITDKLVIPEGFTVRQIANAVAALPGLHLSATKFLAAANSGEVRSPYEPPGVDNLEGLLFPATYQVRQGDSEVAVLEKLVGAFDTETESLGLPAAAQKLHISVYQLVTVASIVERESKLSPDRGPVASVIYNRLRAKIPLGADSTQTYYLRLTHPGVEPTVAQLNAASPYNTRVHPGLPPTAIANPGAASLAAAAAPPNTGYLDFVEINPDGKLGFAANATGFAQLQSECRAAHLC
jgi:UPF0755 protein